MSKLKTAVAVILMGSLFVGIAVGIVMPAHHKSATYTFEQEIINLLLAIHKANEEYYAKNQQYLPGQFARSNKIQELFNLDLNKNKWECIYERLEKNEYIASCDWQHTFPNWAGEMNDFSILITQKEIGREGSDPNPCCVSRGRCPSLPDCTVK